MPKWNGLGILQISIKYAIVDLFMPKYAKMEWSWYPPNFDKICNSLTVLHPLNNAKNKHIFNINYIFKYITIN